METNDVLHKTTYIWKEEDGYAVIIKNDGGKAILNKADTMVWNHINDEDSIDHIADICHEKYGLNQAAVFASVDRMMEAGLVTKEDMFWGDDLL